MQSLFGFVGLRTVIAVQSDTREIVTHAFEPSSFCQECDAEMQQLWGQLPLIHSSACACMLLQTPHHTVYMPPVLLLCL